MQRGALGRRLRRSAQEAQPEASSDPDHGVELSVVLHELDQRPVADRLPQIGRVRKGLRRDEVSFGAAAALPDRRLDPPLAVEEGSWVTAFERDPLEASDGVSKLRQHPRGARRWEA